MAYSFICRRTQKTKLWTIWRCNLTTFNYYIHSWIIPFIALGSKVIIEMIFITSNFRAAFAGTWNIAHALLILLMMAVSSGNKFREIPGQPNFPKAPASIFDNNWQIETKTFLFGMKLSSGREAAEHTVWYTVSNRINTTNFKMIISIATKCKLSQG